MFLLKHDPFSDKLLQLMTSLQLLKSSSVFYIYFLIF